jgi:hypothetical protein
MSVHLNFVSCNKRTSSLSLRLRTKRVEQATLAHCFVFFVGGVTHLQIRAESNRVLKITANNSACIHCHLFNFLFNFICLSLFISSSTSKRFTVEEWDTSVRYEQLAAGVLQGLVHQMIA